MAEGEFHEAINLAALWNLPVLFCCENNRYAMGTSLETSESQVDLALKAAAYAIPAWVVDGMDPLEVRRAARRALATISEGGGPVFVEFQTYRFRAHTMCDPELYPNKSEVAEWREHDPIHALFERMIAVFRERTNLAHLMYIADAFGYLGYVLVLLFRNFTKWEIDFLSLFLACLLAIGILSLLLTVGSSVYFFRQLRSVPVHDGIASS